MNRAANPAVVILSVAFGVVATAAIAVQAQCLAGEVQGAQAPQVNAQMEAVQTDYAPPPTPTPPTAVDPDLVKVTDVAIKGRIEGENITFVLDMKVHTSKKSIQVPLVSGEVVLYLVGKPLDDYRLHYDAATETYSMLFDKPGPHDVSVTFAAKPTPLDGPMLQAQPAAQQAPQVRGPIPPRGDWRQSAFTIPSSRIRELEVAADRKDLEIIFPGALRLTRQEEGAELTIKALLGPDLPFEVRWKPQVAELDAKLVLTCEANVIATAGTGAIGVDTLFAFTIAQGKLSELEFRVPGALNVTQVRGRNIRDWRIEAAPDPATPGEQRLSVILNRPQTDLYGLQVLSEMPVPAFPAEVALPVIIPKDIRAGGHIAIGTDSAIHPVIKETSGLSQEDVSAFPRILLDQEHPRRAPSGKAFFYAFATLPYQMKLSLDDIVPSYDASDRLVISVREEDLAVEAQIELDIRDAPIRLLTVETPAGFAVADVTGSEVEKDAFTAREVRERNAQEVEVHFRQPVLGHTLVQMRLELGKGPLDREQKVAGFAVKGAKSERGYIVVTAETGVRIDQPAAEELREVHTGSVPMQVPNAQYAYRFRTKGWTLSLTPRKMVSSIRVEAFHLVSLGEGVAYGSAALSYFISGAPIDELHFRVPPEYQHPEFVGRDVSRPDKLDDEGRWTVRLHRKVAGDYNLGITYSQRYDAATPISVGGIECESVETQTGYIVVAGHLNVQLTQQGQIDKSLLELKREEVPANYRLLVNAPILRAYKYVESPHRLALAASMYEHAALLPAVVEVTQMSTGVNVLQDGKAESFTTIRYKVKNSSTQFLSLSMPPGVNAWRTYLVERDAKTGEERSERVTSSFDDKTKLLMVPLRRYRNPNEAATIQLDYGQSHGQLDSQGRIDLVAPHSQIRSTYADWEVTAPKDWVVLADTGRSTGMVPVERPVPDGLAVVSRGVLWSWGRAICSELGVTVGAVALAIAVILAILAAVLRAWPLARAAGVAVLAGVAMIGVVAMGYYGRIDKVGAETMQTMSFTQVLSTSYEAPPKVVAYVVPAWRRSATLIGAVVVPLLSLVCLALAGVAAPLRRVRRILAALGISGLVFGASQFDVLMTPLAHLFTWGLPAIVLLWFVARVLLGRGREALSPAAAAAALLLCAALAGCASKPQVLPIRSGFVLDRVDCRMTAEKDSVQADLKLSIDADQPLRFPLMGHSVILLSPERVSKHILVRDEGGTYYVEVEKKGKHLVELKLLNHLPETGEEQSRWFEMPIPLALTNEMELTIPSPGMQVEAPTAVRLNREENATSTVARAILAPGDSAVFGWKPRARQIELETTSFFCESISIVRFDTGLVEGRHRFQFQIAQGQLKEVRIQVPANTTVTALEGKDLGTWRFDPSTHELEAVLSTPARDQYVLTVITQVSVEGTPYKATIKPLVVQGAAGQRGSLGVASSPAVTAAVTQHPQVMNVDDFTRDAAALLQSWPAVTPAELRGAYRIDKPLEPVEVEAQEVLPEIRTRENAVFTIADDRLVYNGELAIEIAKAGVFSIDLAIPAGYDIDALAAPEVSHWDEIEGAGGERKVQVHLRNRHQGQVALKLALSRPEAELPEQITVPRASVAGELKHTGQMVISSDRGVRLRVMGKQGVSEINTLEEGIRVQGGLAFKLLKPDWELSVQTEVLRPRINVDFLHVARVTEGLVRHTHHLRYKLYNAGAKIFDVEVPRDVTGLQVTGPNIARRDQVEPGKWRVELAQKWFDRPYPLTLTYETVFDREAGKVAILPVRAAGAELQRGHVVVFTTDRVELSRDAVGPSLEPDDARNLPGTFGAGDLSGAAFCFRSASADYDLSLKATRHAAAALLEAQVTSTQIRTVVNDFGESINNVQITLQVSGKRHLEARLPRNAEVWSLLVNRRSTEPSRRKEKDGTEVLLVPLAQSSSGDLPVEVQLIYALPQAPNWQEDDQMYLGPQFDLPLKGVVWELYLPESYRYSNFKGTLAVDKETLSENIIERYGIGVYEAGLDQANTQALERALDFQNKANSLAQQGRQYEARSAFENAYNYSFSDPALNEDARVQLRGLIREQAVVGLVGNRKRLRQQAEDQAVQQQQAPQQGVPALDLGENFSKADAERLKSSLNKADSENLDFIIERLIETQEAAAGTATQLMIETPLKGRLLAFERPVQVEPNSDMLVTFSAKRAIPRPVLLNWAYGAGLCIVFTVGLTIASRVRRRPRRPEPPAEPPAWQGPSEPPGPAQEPPPAPGAAAAPPADEPAPEQPQDEAAGPAQPRPKGEARQNGNDFGDVDFDQDEAPREPKGGPKKS